ncbi:YgfZ/GcvT domain-containing protein [Roseisolibacter agri]|uniref:Glycine cleavage system protein T n=1 Tax=Roseisolibacter agri TaxID=2014610 RepID=A0AA37Q8C6_9BACT|nr:glycine cleavage T C-terminal barrel domain-containing protein [Roseisolibacter agri]GLC28459.1 glycine cleavage system protein T [Roseisolibacter agri]
MTAPTPPSARAVGSAPSAPPTLVRDYGDPATEYAALRTGALLVDRSHRDRWTLRGAKARETLTGLVTNDVAALAAGHGCYAAALTPKGKIIADVRVFAIDGGTAVPPSVDGVRTWLDDVALVVDVPARAAEGWGGMLKKYVNPRLAPYARITEQVRAFGLYGVHARDALAAAFGTPPSALSQLAPYGHATLTSGGEALLVVRVPDLGLDGFEVLVPASAFDAAWARVAGAAPGIVAGGELAYAIARVEAGYPEWGQDVDDGTLPQEANLDELRAISYTKGCYTGQEVVARIHFRGHVNRHLRGLAYPPDGTPVPRGAQLLDEEGRVVGDVRSSMLSPRLGGVALGMVRREVPLGAVLTARWSSTPEDGAAGDGAAAGATADDPRFRTERGVTVGPLPFPL